MTWPGSGTSSNSHSVAARSSCTTIPLASGEGSGGRDHSPHRLFPSHRLLRFVHLDPPGLIRPREIGEGGRRRAQACLRMAPSIRTPAVAYFQSATSSLRARAMIIVLPRRPPGRLIRSRNHTASVDWGGCRSHSQAIWIMIVRSRGFPALETPCSRWTDPLCHGVGASFFFQAEDGIRDYRVTGVQTCALPI